MFSTVALDAVVKSFGRNFSAISHDVNKSAVPLKGISQLDTTHEDLVAQSY